jgi:hypothetical protein
MKGIGGVGRVLSGVKTVQTQSGRRGQPLKGVCERLKRMGGRSWRLQPRWRPNRSVNCVQRGVHSFEARCGRLTPHALTDRPCCMLQLPFVRPVVRSRGCITGGVAIGRFHCPTGSIDVCVVIKRGLTRGYDQTMQQARFTARRAVHRASPNLSRRQRYRPL